MEEFAFIDVDHSDARTRSQVFAAATGGAAQSVGRAVRGLEQPGAAAPGSQRRTLSDR